MMQKQPPRLVLSYSVRRDAPLHEVETNRAIAGWLAEVLGWQYGGSLDPERTRQESCYLVPTQTIVGNHRQILRLRGPDDLFGGCVEHPFIATKAITHPLVDHGAIAPQGWSPHFADRVRNVVLEGISAFSMADVRRAGARLLKRGPVRVKPVLASGGRGQYVVHHLDELEVLLAEPDAEARCASGIVLEEELHDVVTFSVGQVRIGGLLLSYHGHQHQATDLAGEPVYGGSDLLVVRGGYSNLLAREMSPELRLAVEQAQTFDAAADALYSGFFASRRNYDIVRGVDHRGEIRSGVLEQSWRMGGATGAEVAAAQAFSEDPSLQAVRATTVEQYDGAPPPAHATILFQGWDDEVGWLLKYATVEAYVG